MEEYMIKGRAAAHWNYQAVDHKGYTDLGDYVIDLGAITQEEYAKGIQMINERLDSFAKPMCTAVVKRNHKGEVIVGRNQDLEVSNYPAFISHLTGGKYQTINFYYNNVSDIPYSEFQKGLELPDGFRGMYAVAATDSFNEKGLYIQANMRWGGDHPSSGTNPGGTRMNMFTIAGSVAQNAATLKEALEYIKTLDLYSTVAAQGGSARGGWDAGYLIGDATGEYGFVEFASNRVYFTPYGNGHCNAYVSPILQTTDRFGAGYGRLAMGVQSMIDAETAEEMLEAIHQADWRREIEDIQSSYKDEQGNPHFVDKDGNPSIDFRTELTMMFAVDDLGNPVRDPIDAEACQSLKVYLDWLNCADYSTPLYYNPQDKITPEEKEQLAKLSESINTHYHENCTREWLMNDANFDDVKELFMEYFTSNNSFELIRQFNEGEEKAIRDKGDIFTTGMNFGVNCAQKYLKVRFWEHKDTIYEYHWD